MPSGWAPRTPSTPPPPRPRPDPPPGERPAPRPAARVRADQLVVDRGLARSRAEAQALILAGAIHLEGEAGRRLTAGLRLDPRAALVRAAGPSWASRGGEKLAAALVAFGLDPSGLVCLDAGASTGGFTDVLLAGGARRVYAVDVGHGQLLPRLAADPRVVVMDRTNLRALHALPESVDLATLDLSFISLRLVLPVVRGLLGPTGRVVALVKPQFEAGRADVPRGGVIRDPEVHRRVLRRVAADSADASLEAVNLIASPVTGREGNREFLALLRWSPSPAEARSAAGLAWDTKVESALS